MTASASIISYTLNSVLEANGVSPESYSTYVDQATEALVEKVYAVSEVLLETAVNEGLNRNAAKELIESVGLDFRPEPEPEVEEEVAAEPTTLEGRVDALANSVDSLAATVGQLVALASSKLGVTL